MACKLLCKVINANDSCTKCNAITKKGHQCTRWAAGPASSYCTQHQNCKTVVQKTKEVIAKIYLTSKQVDPYESLIIDGFDPNKNILAEFSEDLQAYCIKRIHHVTDYVFSATKGVCPAKNKPINKAAMAGRIRSWIEERSGSSRQHYFRGGTLRVEGWRPNLFYNPLLSDANSSHDFMPYKHVRGSSWYLKSTPGELIPSRKLLLLAEREIECKGMQGSRVYEPAHFKHSLKKGPFAVASGLVAICS